MDIKNIDLEPIMVKLMDKEEGLGWTIDFTRRVENEYRKFLSLCKKYPDTAIVPSSNIDDFWHFHILDTLKYRDDCEDIFGYFLHHFPYFGMRGEDDEKNLIEAWNNTINIYKTEFGEIDSAIWVSSKRCPNCGRRCSNDSSKMEIRPRLDQAINNSQRKQ